MQDNLQFDIALRAGDAGNLLQRIERAPFDVVEVGLLNACDLLQLVKAQALHDVLLEHEAVVLILDLVQDGGNVRLGLLCGIVRRDFFCFLQKTVVRCVVHHALPADLVEEIVPGYPLEPLVDGCATLILPQPSRIVLHQVQVQLVHQLVVVRPGRIELGDQCKEERLAPPEEELPCDAFIPVDETLYDFLVGHNINSS